MPGPMGPPGYPPPSAPAASQASIDAMRVEAEAQAVLMRQAVETSHRALAESVRQTLAAQAVATPIQQIINNHHETRINQAAPIIVGPQVQNSIYHQSKHQAMSVHQYFLQQAEAAQPDPVVRPKRPALPDSAPMLAIEDKRPRMPMAEPTPAGGEINPILEKPQVSKVCPNRFFH